MPRRPRNPDDPPLSVVASTTNWPDPPLNLGKAGRTLWDTILAQYYPLNRLALEVLAEACVSRDRSEALRLRVENDAAAPSRLIRLELEARNFTARTLARLANAEVKKKPVGRPPTPVGWRPPWVQEGV